MSDITPNKRFIELYDAVNLLMAKLGADGEVSTDTTEVSNIMDILHDIDGGCPHKAIATHGASRNPRIRFVQVAEDVAHSGTPPGYKAIELTPEVIAALKSAGLWEE